MSEQRQVPWQQIEAYRALLAEQMKRIDQIAGLRNSEIHSLQECQTKTVEPLEKIKEATDKIFKDNKLQEMEKQHQQDGQWTEDKVKALINMIMNLSSQFIVSNSQNQFQTEGVIRQMLPKIEASFGAGMSEEVGILLTNMKGQLEENFGLLRTSLDQNKDEVIGEINSQKNEEIQLVAGKENEMHIKRKIVHDQDQQLSQTTIVEFTQNMMGKEESMHSRMREELEEKNETINDQRNEIAALRRHLRDLVYRKYQYQTEHQTDEEQKHGVIPSNQIVSNTSSISFKNPENDRIKNKQIFIKTLTGKTYTVNANIEDTINELKEGMARKSDYRSEEIRLIFAGKSLEDDRTLMDYNIQNESTIHAVFRLRAG